MNAEFVIGITMVAYLILMIAIGVRFSKNTKSTEDFYLGGRKMGPLVTAMSAEASDMSSWLLMGLPGLAYLSGICDPGWTALGLVIGTWLNWFFVSKRLRRYSEKVGAITVPDFFSKRYHDKKNILNAVAALVILIFFIPYTASGFAACGKLFHSLFGADYQTAMIISAVVIVGYTVLGGFSAVCTTDLIQSIVMTMALVVILFYGIHSAGGMGAVLENARAMEGYFSMTAVHDAVEQKSSDYSVLTIVSTMAWGLGYFGMPHILIRFMAIEDEKKLVLSRRIASIWALIAMTAAIFIGVIGIAMTSAGKIPYLEGSSSETVIVKITDLISGHGVFAALIAGVILAGMLAATMSTSDSQMLAAASSMSQNIIQDFMGIRLSAKNSLRVARATILVITAIGIFLARDPESNVFGIVSFAWAGFGGAFGAVVLCSLFLRRTNMQGAFAGMLSGGIMVFVWKYAIRPLGGVWNIYELLPAFVVSMVMIVTVSLVTEAPAKDILKEYDLVVKGDQTEKEAASYETGSSV